MLNRVVLVICISIILVGMSSAFILNPNEAKTGNYVGTTLNSSYSELVSAWFNGVQNTTQTFSNMIWVPWYSSDNVCTIANLQSGGNCNIAPINMTQNCMVSDELSQVALGLSMDTNATRFDLMYNTIRNINSSYGVIPSWKIFRNETTIYVCDSRINSNCNTASDATARFVMALFNAGNNTAFNANNRSRYRDLAINMTADMFKYELNYTYYQTRGSGNLTYWLSSGAVQRNSGMGSTDYSYTAYFADVGKAFFQACSQLQNKTYCAVARNISQQYLEASYYNGVNLTFPPGRSFKWENITGFINVTCTNTCSPPQWDSADAPRAFGMGELEYYSNFLTNYTVPNLTSYMYLWRNRYMGQNVSVPIQYNPNGTASAANQSGYFSQGLQAMGLMGNVTGNGLILFNQTLRSALGHYDSTPKSMDFASCFGVYGQTFPIRALGSAIGYDQNSYMAFGQDLDNPQLSLRYPTNTSYTSLITVLNYTVSDTTIQSCWYSLDAGVTNKSLSCGTNVTGINATEGAFTWLVAANDTSGNLNVSSVSFSVFIGNADLEAMCHDELDGLQSFGDLLPLVIIALVGGAVVMFLVGSADSFDFIEDSSFNIVIAIIVVAFGAPIIITIFQSTLSSC